MTDFYESVAVVFQAATTVENWEQFNGVQISVDVLLSTELIISAVLVLRRRMAAMITLIILALINVAAFVISPAHPPVTLLMASSTVVREALVS